LRGRSEIEEALGQLEEALVIIHQPDGHVHNAVGVGGACIATTSEHRHECGREHERFHLSGQLV
jgi:hypothetical protein